MNITVKVVLDEDDEDLKLKEFLKRVDDGFYHKIIQNRQMNTAKYFPHRGENGSDFIDTFQYVKLK